MKILNYGSLNLDLVYDVEEAVKIGQTIKAKVLSRFCGGKGLNQSIALAAAGAEVYHAGKVGEDGGCLLEKLKKRGVRTGHVTVCGLPSGHAVIQVQKDGDNCIIVYPGANGAVEEDEIERVLAHFGAGDVLVLQNEINAIPQIMRLAHGCGMKIVFNPSPFQEEILHYPLELVDLFMVNRSEAAALFGLGEGEEPTDALLRNYPRAEAVVTLGGEGAVYFGRQGSYRCPAAPAQVVDTTAAGDTFLGYFVARYFAGTPAGECMKLASRASAIAISRKGAADSIPDWRELEETEGSSENI